MTRREGLTKVDGGWIHDETELFIEQIHATRWAIWESHEACRKGGKKGLALDHCESLGEALEAVETYLWATA